MALNLSTGNRNRGGHSSSLAGADSKIPGKRFGGGGGGGKPPHKPGSYPDPQKLASMGKNTEPSEAAQKLLQKVKDKAKQEVTLRNND